MSSSMGECHRRLADLICDATARSANLSAARDRETDRVDVLDVVEVHEVLRKVIDDLGIVDGLGSEVFVVTQLRRPKDCEENEMRSEKKVVATLRTEDGKVVVVEPLCAVRACWLEPVRLLQPPADEHVPTRADRSSAWSGTASAIATTYFQKMRMTIALLSASVSTPSLRSARLPVMSALGTQAPASERIERTAKR